MLRRPFVLVGLVSVSALLSVGCARYQVVAAGDTEGPSVANTETVYIGSFGLSADGVQARAALTAELERRGLFRVVPSAEEADAVIEGRVSLGRQQSTSFSDSRYSGDARLTDRASGRLVWRHQYVHRTAGMDHAGPLTPDLMIQRVVSQFCDELEMAAARGASARHDD